MAFDRVASGLGVSGRCFGCPMKISRVCLLGSVGTCLDGLKRLESIGLWLGFLSVGMVNGIYF